MKFPRSLFPIFDIIDAELENILCVVILLEFSTSHKNI